MFGLPFVAQRCLEGVAHPLVKGHIFLLHSIRRAPRLHARLRRLEWNGQQQRKVGREPGRGETIHRL